MQARDKDNQRNEHHHHHDGVRRMSKRIVTFMLFIQFRPQHVHGLCSIIGCRATFMNQAPRSFLNGIHGNGSGRGQAYRTSTGMAMEQFSSASPSPGDNTYRIDGRNNLNYDLINSILQKHGVKSNELDERCLVALSGCPSIAAEYSVHAYAQQKRKREQKKEAKISDPSSYIMAVLRKKLDETTKSSASGASMLDPSRARRLQTSIKAETGNLAEKSVSLPPPNRVVATNIKTTTSSPATDNRPQRSLYQRSSRILGPMTTNERKEISAVDIERVSLDYVDKCLACLAQLEQPIIQLPGVGPATEACFHKLGIFTLRDLLWNFPRTFIDRSKLQKSIFDVADGDVGTFRLIVQKSKVKHNTVSCIDESGNNIDVSFFYGQSRQGMIMASSAMKKLCNMDLDSTVMIVSGKMKHSEQNSILFNPDLIITPDQSDKLGIEAVYHLTSGLSQKKVVAAVDVALSNVAELFRLLPETIPDDLLASVNWPSLADAFHRAHKPTTVEEMSTNSPSRQRIAFEELSMQQAEIALSRWELKHFGKTANRQSREPYASWRDSPLVSAAVNSLPFNLTLNQDICLDELWDDSIIGGDGRMLRLLQGDVGSGKTVVAYLLGLGCIEAGVGGRVVSLMCPTQLLASQHARTISQYASRLQQNSDWRVNVELLNGTVTGNSRDDLLLRLETSDDKHAVFLIGTHALTTPDIIDRLEQLPPILPDGESGIALAIIDEEQRFGVRQRQILTKAASHSLLMSATPIPRSISHKRCGLVDFTHLESEPRRIETSIVPSDSLDKVLSLLGKKVEDGSKCFWVVPRIERNNDDGTADDSTSDLNDVGDRYKMLVETFGEERVCRVHGRMLDKERDEQIARFADPNSQAAILVGTTVIEVGIDIPGANILIVENADRFGLSQLHQLRGRIGRAGSRSDISCHCLLLTNVIGTNREGPSSLTRLQIMQKSNRGEEIADADFLLRGPGDVLGIAQSGMKFGPMVDPEIYWDLLDAATHFGRGFLQPDNSGEGTLNEATRRENTPGVILSTQLFEGKTDSYYNQSSASSKQGVVLRMMMVFFGERAIPESNTLHAINALQRLDGSRVELSELDKSIHAQMVAFFGDISSSPPPISVDNVTERKTKLDDIISPVTIKPKVPKVERINLLDENVAFLVLDVETTGLDDETCHVIQMAAKILGSDNEDDIFSEYILPPIDSLPKNIEKLTGITDEFLRCGGYDPLTGKKRGTAREFRDVYLDFQTFCNERAKGRQLVLVAHNAKFDLRMINGELKRWRYAAQTKSVPLLSDTFGSSLDTLQLFRHQKMWGSSNSRNPPLPRPSSFKLSELYSYVFNESVVDSHNAVGDIKALERLLLSGQFNGWKSIADNIQEPFVRIVTRVTDEVRETHPANGEGARNY